MLQLPSEVVISGSEIKKKTSMSDEIKKMVMGLERNTN